MENLLFKATVFLSLKRRQFEKLQVRGTSGKGERSAGSMIKPVCVAYGSPLEPVMRVVMPREFPPTIDGRVRPKVLVNPVYAEL